MFKHIELHPTEKGVRLVLHIDVTQHPITTRFEFLSAMKLTFAPHITANEDTFIVQLQHGQVNSFLEALIQKFKVKDNLILQTKTHVMTLREKLQQRETPIPAPPPPPAEMIPGFNVDGFWPLIKSLSIESRLQVLHDLKSEEVVQRAETLASELQTGANINLNNNNSRDTFLAALLCLQQEKISKSELASLHLLDSAIHTLYKSPASYMIHRFIKDKQRKNHITFFNVDQTINLPTEVSRFLYTTINKPRETTPLEEMPFRMHRPLIARFFNFTFDEWDDFCVRMETAPQSEKYFNVLISPEHGCWSSIVFTIQKYIKCMRVLDWFKDSETGYYLESIMVVPSFTMFQNAIYTKAKTLGRKPVELIPTYYYLDGKSYHTYKCMGNIPLTMYLPESTSWRRYSDVSEFFRTKVDGHIKETSFAGAIHDVYHALREMEMTDEVAAARFRLDFIAKQHPDNAKVGPPIDETLSDGELIHSYSMDKDTIYEAEFRSAPGIFGDILTPRFLPNLTPELKYEFIEDMVKNKDQWQENFNIGRDDLREDEQALYDSIEHDLIKSGCLKP